MINILVNGCNGKMGKEVISLLLNNPQFSLIGGLARRKNDENTFKTFTSYKEISPIPDVIIDFSNPISTLNLLKYATFYHIPLVIATTGFNYEETLIISKASKKIPIFKSANMSFSINVMAKVVSRLSKIFEGSDIEIVETHHNNKIDAPSRYSSYVSR